MARPRSDIRPRLLHAARRRFLAEGVDGASLRTIARDAKTNVGMVVYYFPTKDELFLAVVEQAYAGLLQDLTHALRAPATVQERLGSAFARLGAASEDELEVLRLVLREALLVPPSLRFAKLLSRFRHGHFAVLVQTLAEGVNDGELDGSIPLPLLMITTFAMAGVPQIIRRIAADESPFSSLPSPPALAEKALELLMHGIGARGRRMRSTAAPKQKRLRSRS
jgi:AcrR family transcriptional regulator